MLTVPFIQSKSPFASLTILEPHLLSQSSTEKTVCGNIDIYIYTDTIIKQHQIRIKITE